MTILDRLNSGDIHAIMRAKRPDCVDALGNIHSSPARRAFIDWRRSMVAVHGDDVASWPHDAREEFNRRHVRR